jgi:hypothetical protein
VSLPPPARRRRAPAPEPRQSNAAIPVAVALVAVGLYLGTYSVLLTALFGLVLLVSAGSLLATRVNPLSPTFYLTKRPSFLAIGIVFLGALILFGGAYTLWSSHAGPLMPRL